MVLVKILKRKDASSVIIAIVLALILNNFLLSLAGDWSNRLVQTNNYSSSMDWQTQYLLPLVMAALSVIVLEVLCWLYLGVVSLAKKK